MSAGYLYFSDIVKETKIVPPGSTVPMTSDIQFSFCSKEQGPQVLSVEHRADDTMG